MRADSVAVPFGALNLRTYPTEQTIKEGIKKLSFNTNLAMYSFYTCCAFCQRSMQKKGLDYLRFEFGCKISNRLRTASFWVIFPPSLHTPLPNSASGFCVRVLIPQNSHMVGGGLAWLEAPLPHKGISPVLTILLCSLKLHDIWVMLLL